ncbi:hypothetical protein CRG98_018069 [Punica granatum]|uniref:Retrotransposon gag domain-containing protein n=1 Tax=Punica granatum TaxID=22663 RepID=A0A2I0K0G4_PUNGR|nr:hypothetical protein CRG98_018069 [Punica granatum]
MGRYPRFVQGPGEKVKDYIARFKIAKQRCKTYLLEDQFVKLCINELEFKLKKKFEGIGFHDFFDLVSKMFSYERLLREEANRKRGNRGHIHAVFDEHDEDLEVGVAEIIADKPVNCPPLVRAKSGKNDKPNALDQVKYYTFDVSWSHEIYDFLVKSRLVKFKPDHMYPSAEDYLNRDFCRFHGS